MRRTYFTTIRASLKLMLWLPRLYTLITGPSRTPTHDTRHNKPHLLGTSRPKFYSRSQTSQSWMMVYPCSSSWLNLPCHLISRFILAPLRMSSILIGRITITIYLTLIPSWTTLFSWCHQYMSPFSIRTTTADCHLLLPRPSAWALGKMVQKLDWWYLRW